MNCSSRLVLKIGRTPVHQALDRLMIEGMVEVIPRKGVIVKPVSLNEVLQIIEARLINEPFGSRLAAEQANDSDIAELADVLKRTKHWASLRNVENMMLLDREFHLLVARAAKNDVLTELLRSLHERSLRFWFISLNAPAQYEVVQNEHAAILEAIRERNPNGAKRPCARISNLSAPTFPSFSDAKRAAGRPHPGAKRTNRSTAPSSIRDALIRHQQLHNIRAPLGIRRGLTTGASRSCGMPRYARASRSRPCRRREREWHRTGPHAAAGSCNGGQAW